MSASIEEQLAKHRAERDALIKADEECHFSYELEAGLTEDERKANEKLSELKSELCNPMFNASARNFYDMKPMVEKSKLHQLINDMPKGAVHHIHTSAAPPVDTYIQMTYEPSVYFNERDALLKVFPKEDQVQDGYLSCQTMRQFSADPAAFDLKMRNRILLTREQQEGLESHDIWKGFQHKFTLVTELGKFYPFFKRLLKATIDSCLAQDCFVVELRHISGMLFDEDRKPMTLVQELEIINQVVQETKKTVPHFEMVLIITGLKIVPGHINKMLEHIKEGKAAYPDLFSGFDMVNEEEYNPQLSEYMPAILAAQSDVNSPTYGMPTFCHAGETHNGEVHNLHCSMLLNCKRIGHGFQIFQFPNLVDQFIEKDICIEVCPLSNLVLGYTLDLKQHPIRDLMFKGLQFSISSDDPCFFDYTGVTLDYTMATIAWQLDLRDLKKVSLNGIRYSSISEEKKKHLAEVVFPPKWKAWIDKLNSM